MNESKRTLKRIQRDRQQQKIKQEQDQNYPFQDEEQKLEEEQTKRECKQRKYHEQATMNESKTCTSKCTQRVQQQQQQKIKQEQDQYDLFQDEEQKLEEEQTKRECKGRKYNEGATMNESKTCTLKCTQRDQQQQLQQQKIKQEQDQYDLFQDEEQKLEEEQTKRECKRKKHHERATMNESKTCTLKCTQRDHHQQQQQQKIKQEQDQYDLFQDEEQKLEDEQTIRECKRKKYHERATMNESKTCTLKCTQRDHQQQKIKQEQDQNDPFQDEKQKPKQEQEQAKREFKQKKYHERGQEQKQREGPQMKNERSHGAKQGKFQTIVEAVYSSESTSHYRKVSSQQGVTMQIAGTAQHRAYGRATLIRTHCSDPAHEARPTGTQHKYQNHATSARCRNETPGIKHGSHRGIPHGKMPQIFHQEMQPSLIRAMNPPICRPILFGLSAPVQNSLTPEAMQQSSIANVLQQSSQETGTLMLCAQQPELTLGRIGGNIQGVFQQIINKSGNWPQQ